MKAITAYFNTHNKEPLIVLPRFRFMYFPEIQNGYHIDTIRYGKDVYQLLEDALSQEGGDFIVLLDTDVPTLEIRSAVGPIRCTAWQFLWRDFMTGLKKVQRFTRARLMQRKFSACPADPFGLHKIKAFIKSDRSCGLPEEITEIIITLAIEPKHGMLGNINENRPIRRIETDAFKKTICIKRESRHFF